MNDRRPKPFPERAGQGRLAPAGQPDRNPVHIRAHGRGEAVWSGARREVLMFRLSEARRERDQTSRILIVQPHLGFLSPLLEADYTFIWRFWEGPPIEAVGTIAALVVAGEFPVDKGLAESLPRLGLIACFTSGFDGVGSRLRARRAACGSAIRPGSTTVTMFSPTTPAGLILAAWRKILAGDAQLRAGGLGSQRRKQ